MSDKKSSDPKKLSNLIIADPKFIDPATANFKLQATSPGLDSGTTTLAAATDILGVLRPQGAGLDRGAYEASNLPPAPSGQVKLLPSGYRLAQTLDPAAPNFKDKLTATSPTPTVGSSGTVQLSARGLAGIPAEAIGLFGVLTNVGCNKGGNFRLWIGSTPPNTANLNVPGANPNLNLSTGFTVPLDADGKFYLGLGSGEATNCGYAVDVAGYLS